IKNIEQKVIRFIDEKKLINKNDKILIALSGGPDSVFLLYFLNKFKRRFKIELGALHVNHRLRGNNADEDEKFCKKICKDLGIEYFSFKKNVKLFASRRKISLEEAGRKIRYSVLESTAKKYKYSKIATAHNSSDNAETVLLNLIKGTGIKGISGIAVKRNNIIRPVICLNKDEILNFFKRKKLSYRIDETNLNSNYERNFIRNEIIPLVKSRLNPSFESSVFNSSEVFKKISLRIDNEIDSFFNTVKFNKKQNLLTLFPGKLKNLDEDLLGDFLKEVVKRNFLVQLSFNDINKIVLLFKSKTGKRVNLSDNLSAAKERDQIVIFTNSEEKSFHLNKKIKINDPVQLNGKTFYINRVSKEKVKFSDNKSIEYISGDRCGEFEIRTWKEGDRFYPIGFNLTGGRCGSKKISDFLNEQKIPSILKKKQLVLTTQNNIVWVLGLRLDNRYKLTSNTKKVYRLCLK
ncbi:MAG: tRNA lysidine(34) synthetase TilS, partial [Ignavibacteriaceae bacterium]